MSEQRGKVLSFGPFELSIGNRLLTNGARVVPLGARAMDLLVVLLEQANKVVGRRTLIERVWPARGAEQVSLRIHISALRKALDQSDPGRRYIANVPGRGYSFVVPVTSLSAPASADFEPVPRSRLPARLMRMLGRRDAVTAIQMKLAEQRFVTIVGPGGIGKTTVAVAVAHDECHFQRPYSFRRSGCARRRFTRRAGRSHRTRYIGANKQCRTSLDRPFAGKADAHHYRLLRTPC
jgi:DNA-binding winged helix-turn-helix (wHTH) protein